MFYLVEIGLGGGAILRWIVIGVPTTPKSDDRLDESGFTGNDFTCRYEVFKFLS